MNLIFKNYIYLDIEENKSLLKIRNSENIRNKFKNTKEIEIEEHLHWLKSLKENKSSIYYAIIIDNELVGGINAFNLNEKDPYWGVYVKEYVNPIYISAVTYLFIDYLFDNFRITTLNSEINNENVNAINFNKNFGFKYVGKFQENGLIFNHFRLIKKDWQFKKEHNKVIQSIFKKNDIHSKFLE